MSNHGLLFSYLLDGAGGGEPLNASYLDNLRKIRSPTWLHFDYSDENFTPWLLNNASIFEDWTVDLLTNEETRAKTLIHKETLYCCLRSINLNEVDAEEDMVSVRILIKGNLIITARKRELGIINNIRKSIAQNEGPSSVIEVLSVILESINNVVSDHAGQLADNVDRIEEANIAATAEEARNELSNIRRRILMLKRHLSPQKEALKGLYHNQSALLADFKHNFQEHCDTNIRLVEDLDLARERCGLLQEQVNNKLSEQINKRMYLFSIITTVFLPISSIASIFGMNLGGIPGSNTQWGFGIVCLSLLLISVILIVVLKRNRWF